MENDPIAVPLDHLGVLRARGPDAVRFLQGQLSNDLEKLSPQRASLAGYHNPQGRVIAVLRLLPLAHDDILGVLPRELAPPVAARLSKFVLRAKVKITDDSKAWRVMGDARRELIVTPAAATPAPPDANAGDAENIANARAAVSAWRRLDIAAGLPQVYASTSEEFVAQMLNLDLLDAIAFDKGCYTGQEVIARAHYRGRVKRRLQRFVTRTTAQLSALAPGTPGQLADGRSFKVVDSVQLADGRVEFLAVAPMRAGESDDGAAAASDAPAREGSASPSDALAKHVRIDAEQVPLPYALPD